MLTPAAVARQLGLSPRKSAERIVRGMRSQSGGVSPDARGGPDLPHLRQIPPHT